MNCVDIAPSYLEPGASLYGSLMFQAAGLPNDELFARMLVSQATGSGAMPAGLGLVCEAFMALLNRHFPYGGALESVSVDAPEALHALQRQGLISLLLEGRAGADPSEVWMAHIVATGCMGGNPLWQDLGLWSPADLIQLIRENFPYLATRNTQDMNWKDFLYRQLEKECSSACPLPANPGCTKRRALVVRP